MTEVENELIELKRTEDKPFDVTNRPEYTSDELKTLQDLAALKEKYPDVDHWFLKLAYEWVKNDPDGVRAHMEQKDKKIKEGRLKDLIDKQKEKE